LVRCLGLEQAESLAGNELALEIEDVVNGGVDGEKALS
jgi:hypothetical protein